MYEDRVVGRYSHDVQHWTVGRLREALHGLPDDTVLRVEVATSPSTGHPDPWGHDQFVVTGAAVDDDGDFATGDLVVRVDFSSGYYVLLREDPPGNSDPDAVRGQAGCRCTPFVPPESDEPDLLTRDVHISKP